MNSLPTQAILGTVVVAAVLAAALGSVPLALGLIGAAIAACVASAAQSKRLRGEERLVYRPVHVRRHDVQRRVSSDD